MASNIPQNTNQVQCPKCSGDFKNPTLLACRHILCESCINDLDTNSGDSKENYNCPLCESVSPKSQAKNLTIIQELFDFIVNIGSKANCENCKQNASEWRCKECKYSYCSECRQHHDALDVLKGHTWTEISDDAQSAFDKRLCCVVHEEPIRLYCIKNHQLACALCVPHATQDHEYKNLEDALKIVTTSIKENMAKLENAIKTQNETFLAENEATTEQIKDGYEKIEEQMENQYKNVLEKNKTDHEDQLRKAEDEYEKAKQKYEDQLRQAKTELEEAKQRYEDAVKKAGDRHEEITKEAEEEHNKLRADLYKTKRDQLRVIEQDNCTLELEIRSEKRVVGLCETSLAVAQGATLLKVMGSGLSTSLELHLQHKPVYKSYSNSPRTFFVASEDCLFSKCEQSCLIGTLFMHSKQIPRPLKEIHRLSPKLVSTFKTGFRCIRFDLINSQLWCADYDSNKIHIYSLNGEKLFVHTVMDVGRCYSVVQVNETRVVVATDKGLFLMNTNGEIIQKILNGDFSDASVTGDNIYALDNDSGTVHVLQQQSQDAYVQFKRFKIDDYSSHCDNTIQVTSKNVYVGLYLDSRILQYSHTGDLTASYEETVSGLSRPLICSADTTGTILIADYSNRRLVTLSSEGDFAYLKPEAFSENPQSAVMTKNRLCVYFYYSKSFQIFSLE